MIELDRVLERINQLHEVRFGSASSAKIPSYDA